MQHCSLADVDGERLGTAVRCHGLTDELGTETVAINHYRIPAGEGLPAGLHAHMDQEELFVVLEGVAAFETMDGERTVEAGEAIRFAPGEFQSGGNAGDGELVVLAIGAPRDSEDIRLPATCPDCGHSTLRLSTGGAELTFVCPDCGGEFVPEECPDCGSEQMAMTLDGEGEPVAACRQCGQTFAEPPLRR